MARFSLALAAAAAAVGLACLTVPRPTLGGSFTPFSTEVPPFEAITHPLPPSQYWGQDLHAPFPTNAWWQNLVLVPSTQPVTINPLAMRIETGEVPTQTRRYNRTAEYEHCHTNRQGTHCPGWTSKPDPNALTLPHGSTNKRGCNFGMGTKLVEADLVATFFQPGFVMSAAETLTPQQVTKYDSLSVTLQFAQQGKKHHIGGSPNRVEFPLVRGMPYATALYTQMTPYLFTQNAILAVNDQDLPGAIKGNRLRMKINNEQVVIVYAWKNGGGDDDEDEDELEWQWDRNNVQLTGPGNPKGNWVVRMAILLPDGLSAPGPESIYDQHSSTYPVGGSFDYEFGKAEGDAPEMLTTTINYVVASQYDGDEDTNANSTDAGGDLLMLSLPHHQATFTNPKLVALTVDTLLGTMVGVAGSTWRMNTPAVPSSYSSFLPPRPVDPSRVDALKMQLLKDIQSSSTAGEPDPYGFGKSLSKLGRMALIAEEVGLDAALIHDLVSKMKDFVAPWLDGTNPDVLLYDQTYGGVVSNNGVKDPAQDFGQGYYNDHHFHYGYIVYGCSVIAHFDSSWAAVYRQNIYALARDYANPSAEDRFFTPMRQFDIFDGHSWAAGLFVFADGRNQESSSESINGYYGLMLLGAALADANMEQFGRMLMTLEIVGTRTYWHSQDGQTVYPEVFAKNKCVGMKWSDKVVEATWFAAGLVYIHGINMLPFTPASELYLTADWVREEYPVVISSVTGDITDEWKGFLYGTHCVIDSTAAWQEILGLTSFDGGNTRSNLMYFCATRPNSAKVSHQPAEEFQPIALT